MTREAVQPSTLLYKVSDILPKSTVAEAARLYASASAIIEKELMSKDTLGDFLGKLAIANRLLTDHENDCNTYRNQVRLLKELLRKIDNNVYRFETKPH